MTKRKVSLRLADDEIAVVAPIEKWQHLILVYESFAADDAYKENQQEWQDAADWVRGWISKTGSKFEDDDWN